MGFEHHAGLRGYIYRDPSNKELKQKSTKEMNNHQFLDYFCSVKITTRIFLHKMAEISAKLKFL
jgi:hypothetical protein